MDFQLFEILAHVSVFSFNFLRFLKWANIKRRFWAICYCLEIFLILRDQLTIWAFIFILLVIVHKNSLIGNSGWQKVVLNAASISKPIDIIIAIKFLINLFPCTTSLLCRHHFFFQFVLNYLIWRESLLIILH